jgi:hypothetical protein
MIGGQSVSSEQADANPTKRDDHSTDSSFEHPPSDHNTTLPKDGIFGLLSAKRRRRVLLYLDENGDETTLSDLADHIAAIENDVEIRLLNSQQRKRVYVALYQCHLPKMDDADVIDFDQSRGTVVRRPEADQLYAYLAVEPHTAGDDDSAVPEAEQTVRSKLTNFLS